MFRLFLFFSLYGLSVCEFNILLLHTNDFHAHLQQSGPNSEICEYDNSTKCYGGFARLKNLTDQKIQEAAAKGRPTINLNGGDTFQGTPYYTFFKWRLMAEFVNMLGLDVLSLGNHDFDDGLEGIIPFINNVSVPIVCANLDTTMASSMKNLTNLTPSHVLDVNGTKIGVIGYLTHDVELISNPGDVTILDEITSVRAEAQSLLSQGVSILIALGHSGYTIDQEIAAQVEEIDLVVGGHSHTFLYSGTPPDSDKPEGPYPTVITQASGKKVPVVQAFKHTKYLGYLELNFDDSGNLTSWDGQPILLSGNLSQDTTVLEALKPYEEKVYAKIKRVLGNSFVDLNDDDMKCMKGECNIGNLITDAYVDYVTRHYSPGQGWTKASIGLLHAGEIGGSMPTTSSVYKNGSLTIEDLYAVLQPTQGVAMMNITGSTLLKALETSVARYEEVDNGDVVEFLQVSGLRVVYDVGQASGSRVVSVEVLCADCHIPEYSPLQFDKMYGVVVPHDLAGGLDGYSMLLTYHPIILEDIEYMVVAEYIENRGLIYPAIENRITITNSSTTSSSSKLGLNMLTVVLLLVSLGVSTAS